RETYHGSSGVGHPSCVPMGLSSRFHREHEARQFIGDVVHSEDIKRNPELLCDKHWTLSAAGN
ncbi:hypothetical protein SAMN02746089_01436, partial [Caldanaerobius fijiensis DSM 17918]